MVRYSGVFANGHHLRPFIVPSVKPSARAGSQLALFNFVGKPMPLTDASIYTATPCVEAAHPLKRHLQSQKRE